MEVIIRASNFVCARTTRPHMFYFILECNDFKSVSTFLGPPMLTHHSAKIAPVISLEETFELSFMQKSNISQKKQQERRLEQNLEGGEKY